MCCTVMPNKGTYKGSSAGLVCIIATDMSEEEKQQNQTFVTRCLQGDTILTFWGLVEL
jgi:hypothetical protein